MSLKDKILNYIKEKWSLAKPILINYLSNLKTILFGYLKDMWSSIKVKTVNFMKIVWIKTKDMLHSIKVVVFEKEMALLEKWADWLLVKADKIYVKLNGDIEDFLNSLDDDFSEESTTSV